MNRHERTIVVILSAFWLTGCATSALEMAPSRPDRPWTPVATKGANSKADAETGYILPANPALAAVPPPPAVNHAKSYTLAELIDLAQQSNPTTRVAWNEARRAALAAGIAESAYLPRITASAIGGFQSSNGQTSALGTTINDSDSLRGTVSAVSLQWLLFDFGERAALVEAAKQGSTISNVAFTAAHQQVIYDVSVAFYARAAAQARLKTATQSLKNARAVEASAEDRSKQGIGTVMEVAQARQGTAQANLAVVQATGGAQNAYLGLISAMGISPLTKIEIADISNRRLSPSMVASVETIISQSLARRPDVQSAYAAQKAAMANVRAAQAQFMPKFFLTATGTYNSGGLDVSAIPSAGTQSPTVNINGDHLGGSIFAGVTFPLYDGGMRDAALARARAEADSATARLTRMSQDAVREIALSDNALRTSLSAYDASQTLAAATQTTFDAALAAYRSGVGSITDLTLAQTQLLQARISSTDARSTALSAAAALALSTGMLGGTPK